MYLFDLKKIGENLRKLRKEKNKSQNEVSTESDISMRAYQRIEANEVNDVKLSTIIKLLNYYNITLEELLK